MSPATVTSTSPLLVREDGASTPTQAKVLGGVAYTPVLNDRVAVDVILGRLYVIGAL